MSQVHRSTRGGNEGIVGNVTADVVAVGRNATATKTVMLSGSGRAELDTAILQLQQSIKALQLPAAAHETLKADISQLQVAVAEEKPDPGKVQGVLSSITGKLKMLGDATKSFTDLIEPVTKIAGLFHLSMAAIGLL